MGLNDSWLFQPISFKPVLSAAASEMLIRSEKKKRKFFRLASVSKKNIDMKKLIVWFVPKSKKIYFNQFHIEAENNNDAIEQCKKNCDFEIKIMGISCYNGTNFVNNKIY